jgi:hypothetical protein
VSVVVVVVVVAAGSVGGTAAGSAGGAGSVTAAGAASSGGVSACGPQAARPNARAAATEAARTSFVFVIGQYPSFRRDSFVAAEDSYKLSHGDASTCRTQLPGFPAGPAFLRPSHAFLPGLGEIRQARHAVNAALFVSSPRCCDFCETVRRACWIRPLRRRKSPLPAGRMWAGGCWEPRRGRSPPTPARRCRGGAPPARP